MDKENLKVSTRYASSTFCRMGIIAILLIWGIAGNEISNSGEVEDAIFSGYFWTIVIYLLVESFIFMTIVSDIETLEDEKKKEKKENVYNCSFCDDEEFQNINYETIVKHELNEHRDQYIEMYGDST